MKYIDLSYTLENGIAVYPGDEKLRLNRNKFLSQDGYNDSKLETGMHVGTHIDVPSHLTDRRVSICDYPPERFIGKGCLLDVRGEECLGMKEAYKDQVQEGDIVLLYTGYDQYFGKESYFNEHPIITRELAEFLVSRKVKLVGMDLPSPDHYPFEVHQIFFARDILIIENMRNLGSLLGAESFEVIAMPLNIKAEASLVRAVAKID